MDKITLCCSCHFGLEKTLKYEIQKIGGEDIEVTDGRINFTGDKAMVARANICLATAERVLIELANFKALTFEDLFQGVKKLPLHEFILQNEAFPVIGTSLDSKLHSVPACQAIIKKAAVEAMKSHYKINIFPETGAKVPIRFMILKDVCRIYLDTSGIGLHKRGYRAHSNTAPIKETLAAGMVDLARVRKDSVVCDPFCGSGTILIEAAYKALNIAPGLRRKFLSEDWAFLDKEIWQQERERAVDLIDRSAKFEGYGFDIDPECVKLSLENAKKAGVAARIHIKEADVADFERPVDGGFITICNPPYGERMLDIENSRKIYQVMGRKFEPSLSMPLYVISSDEEFEQYFGKKSDKKRKLYNGMLKCNLYQYFKDRGGRLK